MEEPFETKILTRFEKYEEFFALQQSILALDMTTERSAEDSWKDATTMQQLFTIFTMYREQNYLLDPFLEKLVTPVVDKLKAHAQYLADTKQSVQYTKTLTNVGELLYYYIKCRGYKTIVRFFPHEIADLSVALEFIQGLDDIKHPSIWPLQYIVLLWISLICMIPFDLNQFDEVADAGRTASTLETIAKNSLGKSGLARQGASVLLSRLYVRNDTRVRLPGFVEWSASALGVLETLCETVKISPADIILSHATVLFRITELAEQSSMLMTNAVVRKARIKLVSRIALRMLPAAPRVVLRKGRIISTGDMADSGDASEHQDEDDIPEEIETVLEQLMHALQDRDTIVRWSAAKAVARIAERLPADFTNQVVDTVFSLFSIHSIGVASLYDMPAIAESTWHGTCLACAELARRGLVADDKMPDLINWISKALYFDIRKGAHSVGSSVRDAAAYVLWSLARAYDKSVMEPFALDLARKLVAVSVYDREIHIRRAVSAAFQEYVGRMAIFPHGIDVLGKTDFFAVGLRRNSFTIAAPQVAQHEEYRASLIDHVINVGLRHWDSSMRLLAAQSLRRICELNLVNLGPECAQRVRVLLKLPDPGDVQGGLLALAEIASAYSESGEMEKLRSDIFTYLADAPFGMIESSRHELVTAAACELIASSISLEEIQLSTRSTVPHWRKVVDVGLKHRNSTVQEAASNAMNVVSRLVDCSATVQRYASVHLAGAPMLQQSLARLLGRLDYTAHPHGISEALDCLLESVKLASPKRMQNIEARRNCFTSMTSILTLVAPQLQDYLKPTDVCTIMEALIGGLEDYTLDERGDVGSWVRIACIQGLTTCSLALIAQAGTLANFADYLPAARYLLVVAGILKQGVERLDNVRQQAGEHFLKLLSNPLPLIPDAEYWRIRGEPLMQELFLSDTPVGWQDSSWIFPRAVRLLEISEYRRGILTGLLLSIGSKTHSTQLPVSNSLIEYARSLPLADGEKQHYDLVSFVHDAIAQAKTNLGSNNNVIPVLQLFNLLLEADVLDRLVEDPANLKSLQALLSMTSRGVSKLKNVQRIQECMKVVINLLTLPAMYDACVMKLPEFISHPYPTIRAAAAEHLYLVLQTRDLGRDTEEAEELLLETEWLSPDKALVDEATRVLVEKLS
ncbi:TBCD protein [Artomyces pyxidatus]|uniref:TBCD protein n=1 Tax=Artomyces pyxidatus TaxID=48021 RepID=A0ACB8T0U1_9AGAM|nr:TBCD protein [Artomyces pyxidatus]